MFCYNPKFSKVFYYTKKLSSHLGLMGLNIISPSSYFNFKNNIAFNFSLAIGALPSNPECNYFVNR